MGSTGHRAGLSNEGNTTLPHTSTPRGHLQSQAPLPASITPSVIDPRHSERQEAYKPSEDMALWPVEWRPRLMNSVGFVYKSTREQILISPLEPAAGR